MDARIIKTHCSYYAISPHKSEEIIVLAIWHPFSVARGLIVNIKQSTFAPEHINQRIDVCKKYM